MARIAVDSEAEIMEKIKAYPVKAINDHWFSLPNGTKIEAKTAGRVESRCIKPHKEIMKYEIKKYFDCCRRYREIEEILS